MKEHNITIGERDFTFYELKAFDAVKHGMRLKGILSAGFADLDAGIGQALSGLDENTLEKVIFPILEDCAVVCTSEKSKMHTAAHMNAVYSVADLDEFFEMVGAVLKVNFGPLVKKTLSRFGVDLDKLDLEKIKKAVQEKMQTVQK